jgi:hypothetical protein
VLKKETFPLVVEHSVLLDLRRILFKNNLTPQKFMSFLIEKAVTNDNRLVELIQEAQEETLAVSTGNKRLKSLNADELYALIEEEDKRHRV